MIITLQDNISVIDDIRLSGSPVPVGLISDLLTSQYDLFLEQGDSYLKKIVFRNTQNNLDLTEYTYTMEIKEYAGTKKLDLLFPVLFFDYIEISATETETAKMNKSRYVYRLKATNQNETVTLMFGQILVTNF
jgi:hypothetical protein